MPTRQLIAAAEFKSLVARGATADDLGAYAVFKAAALGSKTIDREQRIVEFVLSSAATDREGDSISVDGWNLADYNRNAVVLWAHEHDGLPVARALTTWVEGRLLKARDQFVEEDVLPPNDVRRSVYRMIVGGYLNAVSVGFQPTEWRPSETGLVFLRQDLLEHSVCPVPAHPDALVVARAKGIDTAPLKAWAEKALDLLAREDCGGDRACELQRLRAQADPAGRKLALAIGELKMPVTQPKISDALDQDERDAAAGVHEERYQMPELPEPVASELRALAEKGVVPPNVSTATGDEAATWAAPTLGDFTDKAWGDLSDAEKRKIAGHYAWTKEMPPAAFGSLKLGHHNPSDGKVNWRGLIAATGRLNQTSLPSADLPKVKAHLRAHYKAFGKEIPDVLKDAASAYPTCPHCGGAGLEPEAYMGDPKGQETCGTCHGVGVIVGERDVVLRWNRRLSKEFDIGRERFEPDTTELAMVSRYTGLEVKHLEQQVVRVMSARMGSYLSAITDTLARDAWTVDDLRNLTRDGKECPPLYQAVQLNSLLTNDFLVDGMRFMRRTAEGAEVRAALRVEPRWYGLDLTAYGARAAGTALRLLNAIAVRAAQYKYLKGEAFALCGEFLPRGTETWDDLFLDRKNAAAVRRVVDLINAKGAALDNRGLILCGPPGTGKTLSARIMLNLAQATFVWVSARDFHYAGGFGGITEAFDLARENAPSIVVFEDIDNYLGPHSVDLLKSEMDGVARTSGVVTVLTTNFPETLPAALIDRPGRFHDVLRFGLPDAAGRRAMIARWIPDLDEASAAAAVAATAGYSGAHMRELARFAAIIGEQDELPLADAVKAALAKLAEQRDLITAIQSAGSRYRAPAEIVSRLTARSADERLLTTRKKQQLDDLRKAADKMRDIAPATLKIRIPVGKQDGAETPDEEAAEEAAELVQYQTLALLADQLVAQAQSVRAIVAALVAAETESPTETPAEEAAEEVLEEAQLSSIAAILQQICGTVAGAFSAVDDCLTEEDDDEMPPAPPAYGRAQAVRASVLQLVEETTAVGRALALIGIAKAGARHSATDMRLLQDAHDSIVALGATCAPPAAADDGKAAEVPFEKREILVLDEEVDFGDVDMAVVEAAVEASAREARMRFTGRVD